MRRNRAAGTPGGTLLTRPGHRTAGAPDAAPVPALRASGVQFSYRTGPPVLHEVNLSIPGGQWVALVGRNGCGKSTLLQCLAGALRPQRGRIEVGPTGPVEVGSLPARQRALRIGLLHQSFPPVPGLTVAALVEQGRYPHLGLFGRLSRDRSADGAVDRALAAVGLTQRADDELDALSGGQRQRARLAVVVAQQAPILLLDEPTSHLDVHHQLRLLDLVDQLRRERGLTVVTVLHDVDQARRYADRVVAMVDGTIVADGAGDRVATPELLAEVFGVAGRLLADGRLIIDRPLDH